jgi:hypothetical protein
MSFGFREFVIIAFLKSSTQTKNTFFQCTWAHTVVGTPFFLFIFAFSLFTVSFLFCSKILKQHLNKSKEMKFYV